MAESQVPTRLLFVCMGNICRSPTAEGVMRAKLAAAGLSVEVDSAGTHGYHVGAPPDERSQLHARRRGFDLSAQRARQLQAADFERYDWVLVMDEDNRARAAAICPPARRDRLQLFLPHALGAAAPRAVPDPYYGGADGFETVLDLCEQACDALIKRWA
jgi:protein-tyrosine phosphatase